MQKLQQKTKTVKAGCVLMVPDGWQPNGHERPKRRAVVIDTSETGCRIQFDDGETLSTYKSLASHWLTDKPKTMLANIYRLIDGERLLVDVRNVTNYTWERMAKFAKDMDNAGRDYEIVAS